MTEQPKRRGRPPGSKNRVVEIGRARNMPMPDFDPPPPTPMPGANQLVTIAGPEPIRVILTAPRGAFGTPADEQVVEWPAGWRIPQPGDSVHLRKDWGGFVQSTDFDLETGVIRLFLR